MSSKASTANRDGSVHQVSAELALGAAQARASCDAEIARLGGIGSLVTGPAGCDGSAPEITGTIARVVNEFFVGVMVGDREYIAAPKYLTPVA